MRLWGWPIAGFLLFALLPISFLFAADSMLKYEGLREVFVLYLVLFCAYSVVAVIIASLMEGLFLLLRRVGIQPERMRGAVFTLELAVIAACVAGISIFFVRIWLTQRGIEGSSSAWRMGALLLVLTAALTVPFMAHRAGQDRVQRWAVDTGRSAARMGAVVAACLGVFALFAKPAVLPNPSVGARPVLSQARADTGKSPNILLITLDAFSARDMSLYGYERQTTPGIDRFARQAYVFDHAYSNGNFTTPSVASLLTSSRPWKHRVFQLQAFLRGEESHANPVGDLREAGYTTVALTSNPAANPKRLRDSAFEIVFDDFSHYLHHRLSMAMTRSSSIDLENLLTVFPWEHVAGLLDRRGARNSPDAYRQSPQQMLDEARATFTKLAPRQKVFMWVHLWPPHHYYMPPAPYLYRFDARRELDTFAQQESIPKNYGPDQRPMAQLARARYDENIVYAEDMVSKFIESLEASGALDNTIVAISADHGEMFDKGIIGHGHEPLYDPMIHIPLVIRLPGQREQMRVNAVTEQIDILPTLLDLAGVPLRHAVEGKSRRDAMQGAPSDPTAVTMWLEEQSAFSPVSGGRIALLEWPWKAVIDVRRRQVLELYNLHDDPQEDHDQRGAEPARAEAMRQRAFAQLAAAENSSARP